MRALLVDPAELAVTVIDVPPASDSVGDPYAQFRAICAIIGGYFEIAHRFPNGDCLLVDEDAYRKQPTLYFYVRGAGKPFAGRGVIVGQEDDEGDITPAAAPVAEVEQLVAYSRAGR